MQQKTKQKKEKIIAICLRVQIFFANPLAYVERVSLHHISQEEAMSSEIFI